MRGCLLIRGCPLIKTNMVIGDGWPLAALMTSVMFVTLSQTLSEENLDQLDELYKLISPSRDGDTRYDPQVALLTVGVV